MDVSQGWYQIRVQLETTLDRLFDIEPNVVTEFDSLLSIDDMNALGYVLNFPHLTCLMSSIGPSHLDQFAKGEITLSRHYQAPGVDMTLLPAACYKVYTGFKGQELGQSRVVGCIAKCFRHEDKPLDAYRDVNFTMKEFVCLGAAEDAKRHVEDGLSRLTRFMTELGIPFSFELASDPFFDSSGSVATFSKLLPTKRELVFDGHAVGSLNSHRSYFGEKLDIKINGAPVHTSCIAFGLERWISMFKTFFRTPARAARALAPCN